MVPGELQCATISDKVAVLVIIVSLTNRCGEVVGELIAHVGVIILPHFFFS